MSAAVVEVGPNNKFDIHTTVAINSSLAVGLILKSKKDLTMAFAVCCESSPETRFEPIYSYL